MAAPTVESMMATLPNVLNTTEGTQTNLDLFEALDEGIYAEWRQALADYYVQVYRGTATGNFLGAIREGFNVPAVIGESDGQTRVRINRRVLRLWGGVYYDSIVGMAANILQTDPSNITVTENSEGGLYAPAAIFFEVDIAAILALGVPNGEIADFLELLSDDLSAAAAGGVRVTVSLFGGAAYDDGYEYDDPESLYGS